MLSTDGFANSYKNEAEFKKTCQDYYDMIKQHGPSAVDANLKAWLEETSELGCGDDICYSPCPVSFQALSLPHHRKR